MKHLVWRIYASTICGIRRPRGSFEVVYRSPKLAELLAHTQPQTMYRYVNADKSIARRAADILDMMERQGTVSAADYDTLN